MCSWIVWHKGRVGPLMAAYLLCAPAMFPVTASFHDNDFLLLSQMLHTHVIIPVYGNFNSLIFFSFSSWFLSALVFCSPPEENILTVETSYYFTTFLWDTTQIHTHHGSVLVVQTAFGPGQELAGVIFNQPFLELLLDQLKVMPCSGGRVWTGAFKGKATVQLSLLHIHAQTGCRSQSQYARLNTEHEVAFSESNGP